jgi:hypothetical protein
MPEYKGLISSLKKDGEVVVSLRSDDAGVVGAPEMNEIACHNKPFSCSLRME